MNVAKTTVLITTTLLLISCGKNGEVTDWSGLDGSSTPSEASMNADQPTQEAESPQISDVLDPECPECEEPGCCECSADNEQGLNSDDSKDNEQDLNSDNTEVNEGVQNNDNTKIEGETEFEFPIINLMLPVINIPYIPIITRDDEDEQKEYLKRPPICINIDDTTSHWWMVYQLLGNLISYAKLETGEIVTEEVEGGTLIHYSSTLPESSEVVLDIEYLIGTPELSGVVISFVPDNFSMKYYNIPYVDPVFGYVEVDGEIECTGKSFRYANSGKWQRYHTCGVTGGVTNPLTFNFKSKDHKVYFGVTREFKGNENLPENYSFNSGNIVIDGENYGLPKNVPSEVLDCLN